MPTGRNDRLAFVSPNSGRAGRAIRARECADTCAGRLGAGWP